MPESFKSRRPWVAAIISLFLTPMSGMLYVNRGWLCIAYGGVYLALMGFGVAELPKFSSQNELVILRSVSTAFSVIGAIHAFVLAKRRDPDEPLHLYARRWYLFPVAYFGLIGSLLGIRTFLYQSFNAPSVSMEPSVNLDDYFLVSKSAYNSAAPQRGDIVVFYNKQLRNYFIKRIVGLPGEDIQMRGGVLLINGQPAQQRRVSDWIDNHGPDAHHVPRYEEQLPGGKADLILDRVQDSPFDDTDVFHVPMDSYFVLGDNRDNSADSRAEMGYVARADIVGRAAYKFIANGRWVWELIN